MIASQENYLEIIELENGDQHKLQLSETRVREISSVVYAKNLKQVIAGEFNRGDLYILNKNN